MLVEGAWSLLFVPLCLPRRKQYIDEGKASFIHVTDKCTSELKRMKSTAEKEIGAIERPEVKHVSLFWPCTTAVVGECF